MRRRPRRRPARRRLLRRGRLPGIGRARGRADAAPSRTHGRGRRRTGRSRRMPAAGAVRRGPLAPRL